MEEDRQQVARESCNNECRSRAATNTVSPDTGVPSPNTRCTVIVKIYYSNEQVVMY